MSRTRIARLAAVAAAGCFFGVPAPAPAADGGAEAPGAPRISDVDCIRSCARDGRPRGGSLVRVRGRNMALVNRAVFLGRRPRRDDRRGRVGRTTSRAVQVRVPWEAEPGKLSLRTSEGRRSAGFVVRLARLPIVARVRCVRDCAAGRRVRPGSLLLLRGVRLRRVTRATFHGGVRAADDRPTRRISSRRYRSVRVRVPRSARSGTFSVVTSDGVRSPARRLSLGLDPVGPASGIFPVRGPHNYGSSGARFGAGRGDRSHRGQDVMASCGTPLVAARGGTVRYAGYQSAAGHYVVIDGSNPNWDYVYMHLQSPPQVRKGQSVVTGQRLGEVGESGNAQGCHLHFELWSAPGWYVGGEAFDPLPQLQAWDRVS